MDICCNTVRTIKYIAVTLMTVIWHFVFGWSQPYVSHVTSSMLCLLITSGSGWSEMNEGTNGNMWEGNFSLGDQINYSNLCRNFLNECSPFSTLKYLSFVWSSNIWKGSKRHLLFKKDFHLSLLNHRMKSIVFLSLLWFKGILHYGME